MRHPIIVFAFMLAFSHANAADQLIQLPKPMSFDGATKGEIIKLPSKAKTVAAPVDAAAAPAAASASASAAAKDPSASKETATGKLPASSKEAAAAKEEAAKEAAAAAKEQQVAKALSGKITSRLAALRKGKGKTVKRAARPATGTVAPAAEGIAAHAGMPTADGHATHWSYDGEEGPVRWGKINPAWSQCESGTRQSPIDIRDGIKVNLEQVAFDYKPSRFDVIDNGHTVQVNVGSGNRITLTGRTYELMQFHFHRPSEERINGASYPMVVHMVHKDTEGRLAVIALLVDEGTAHNLIQQIWNNLPLERNDPVGPAETIDLNQLLPARRDYYTYMGSLTTPPCSEGVLWVVMKQPIQLSAQQIAIFSRLYPMNARPIQAQAGRLIKESN